MAIRPPADLDLERGVDVGPVDRAPNSHNQQPISASASSATAAATNPCQSRWMPNGGAFGGYSGATAGAKSTGFMDNILGCMRPLLFSFSYKSSVIETHHHGAHHPHHDQWEIPFDEIFELEWVGSGAQGTVFSGRLKNEIVAVKKVRDLKETEIRHLRKLDHENIIKFK